MKEPHMMAVTARLLNLPVLVCEEADGGALGAAIVAATGSGRFKSIQAGMLEWVKYQSKFLPSTENDGVFSESVEMARYKAYHHALYGV